MKRFNISTHLVLVRGFLDDPDTHEAAVSFDESPSGRFVNAVDAEAYAASKVAELTRQLKEANALIDRFMNVTKP